MVKNDKADSADNGAQRYTYRFVQLQQTRDLITTAASFPTPNPHLTSLWDLLNNSTTSPLVASEACEGIASLVYNDPSSLFDILNGFQNVLLNKELSPYCTESIIRTLTQLLLWSSESYPSVYFGIHASQGQVHPYIALLKTQPESWTTILLEVERMLDLICEQLDDTVDFDTDLLTIELQVRSVFSICRPLLSYVLLSSTTTLAWKVTLLLTLNSFINQLSTPAPTSKSYEFVRNEILSFLISILEQTPLNSCTLPFHIQLVQSLSRSLVSKNVEGKSIKRTITAFTYQCLAAACESRRSNLSSEIRYLTIFRDFCRIKYHKSGSSSNASADVPSVTRSHFGIEWVALVVLLQESTSLESRRILIEIMVIVLDAALNIGKGALEDVHKLVALTGVVPLLEALAEEGEDERDNIGDLLRKVERACEGIRGFSRDEGISYALELATELKNNHITGTLAIYTIETTKLINVYTNSKSLPPFHPNAISAPPNIFLPPIFFHPNESVRISSLQTFINILSQPQAAQMRFGSLLLFLYLLRSNSVTVATPLFQLEILYHALPSLIHPNDSIITTKVLRIVMTFIPATDPKTLRYTNSRLAAVGVRMLLELWKRQPRCWKNLRYVISEWVLRRKVRALTNKVPMLLDSAEGEIELAVLSVMRDICIASPRSYSQEMLQFLAALLQSVTDWSAIGLGLVLETIVVCVHADVADIRAIWNVLVSHIASYAIKVEHPYLLQRLCTFFSLAAVKGDGTDSYIEFRQTILKSHIASLITSTNPLIRISALDALSNFTSENIVALFPNTPKQLITSISQDSSPDISYVSILRVLVENEIEGMRRGLFKGVDAVSAKDSTSKGNETLSKVEDVAGRIIASWEVGKTAPGLRSGVALSSLYMILCHGVMQDSTKKEVDIKHQKFYRNMVAALSDITLTDHLLVRISELGGWINFFECVLREHILVGSAEDAAVERNVSELLKDLMDRLDKARAPGICCNILLALTGLNINLHTFNVSSSFHQASSFIRILIDKYLSPDPQNISSLASSDEVQFAARLSLGQLVRCIVMDERAVQMVLDILIGMMTVEKDFDRDDPSNWSEFATGYSLGYLVTFLAASPTKTLTLEALTRNASSFLLEYFVSANSTLNGSIGASLGLASSLDRKHSEDIFSFALNILSHFVEAEGVLETVGQGVVAGAAWVVGVGGGVDLDSDALRVLEAAVRITLSNLEWAPFHFHFLVPFTYHLNARLKTHPTPQNITAFNAQVHAQLQLTKAATSSVATRLSAIFTLGSLAGVNYLISPNSAFTYLFSVHSELRGDVWEAMLDISSGQSDLKVGRSANLVLGKWINVIWAMIKGVGTEDVAISSSAEPKDYGRLPAATSYLRAIFDILKDNIAGPIQLSHESAKILLAALSAVTIPLPPVNWFGVLINHSIKSEDLYSETIRFSSRHASTSTSCMEYLIYQILKFKTESHAAPLLVGEIGFGKVLALAGIGEEEDVLKKRRGMDSISKRITVPSSRCVEIANVLGKTLFEMEDNDQDLQRAFLETIRRHIATSEAAADAKILIEEIRIELMNTVYPLLPAQPESSLASEKIWRLFVEIALREIHDEEFTTAPLIFTLITTTLIELGRISNVAETISNLLRKVLVNHIQDLQAVISWIMKALRKQTENNLKEQLEWIMRILDVLILVNIAGHESVDAFARILDGSLQCWWATGQESIGIMEVLPIDLVLCNTSVLLAWVIQSAKEFPTLESQLIKRMLKLLEVSNDKAIKDIVKDVLNDVKAMKGLGEEEWRVI